jgi:hypothetical protein
LAWLYLIIYREQKRLRFHPPTPPERAGDGFFYLCTEPRIILPPLREEVMTGFFYLCAEQRIISPSPSRRGDDGFLLPMHRAENNIPLPFGEGRGGVQ